MLESDSTERSRKYDVCFATPTNAIKTVGSTYTIFGHIE